MRLHSGARQTYTCGQEILTQSGYQPERYFYKMIRPLTEPIPEPVFPPGYTLRHVADAADVDGRLMEDVIQGLEALFRRDR